jgi:spermidine synthase
VVSISSYFYNNNILLIKRDFFGVLKVIKNKDTTSLMNGTIAHGTSKNNDLLLPLTYYMKESPIGEFFKKSYSVNKNWNIGVVGLGIGGLLGHSRKNQTWTFFEINPTVIEIASNPKYFSFVDHYKPKIILGDARFSLEKIKNKHFDLLIIDAYISDNIPIHLITLEALELYFSKIKSGGVIAFHISNRSLNLEPVLSSISTYKNCYSVIKLKKSHSEWALLSFDKNFINGFISSNHWRKLKSQKDFKIWTDDYASIFSVIK